MAALKDVIANTDEGAVATLTSRGGDLKQEIEGNIERISSVLDNVAAPLRQRSATAAPR